MHCDHAEKSGPGCYRVGRFRIEKMKSRWRVSANHLPPDRGDFATLGGAMTWCQQQHLSQSVTPASVAPVDRA
jgi:hypothetical protein